MKNLFFVLIFVLVVFSDMPGSEIEATRPPSWFRSGYEWCLPGDANGDREVTQADVNYLDVYVNSSGPTPNICGDVDGDGAIDQDDVDSLDAYLDSGGTPL